MEIKPTLSSSLLQEISPMIICIAVIMSFLMFIPTDHIAQAQLNQSSQRTLMAGNTAAISLANGVIIKAINATDKENKLSLNLVYNGSGLTPSLLILSSALNLPSGAFESSMTQLGNMTTANQQGGAVMPTLLHKKILAGTSIINQGWKSPTTLSITLHGNTTLNDANFISVEVLPSQPR
jgi:hypothetical protein